MPLIWPITVVFRKLPSVPTYSRIELLRSHLPEPDATLVSLIRVLAKAIL